MSFENWKETTLKELYIGFFDGPHATPKESETGAIFLGIKNVTENGTLDLENIRYIAYEDLSKWTKRVTPKYNDIVFSYEATLHRYAKIPENFVGCLGRRMALLRMDEKKVDINFIFNYFLGPLWRFEVEKNIFTGATVDRIPLTNVPNFKVCLPEISIQKKIAKILSNYDGLIENNLKQIKLLEEKARLIYEEWFLRFRIDGKKLNIDEKTGLPSGWIKQELSSIVKFEGGFAFKSETYEENQKFKIVTIKNVQDGIFIPNTTDTLSSIPDKVKKYQVLKNGDIIMSLTGNVGRVCLVYGENYLLNQRVVKITPIKKNDYSYVYSMFRHSSMLTMLENISNGAAQQNLSPVSTGKLKVVVPTDEIRKQYEKIVNPIISNIINYNLQNQLLKESRDILLPRLMTGMIDVENMDIEV